MTLIPGADGELPVGRVYGGSGMAKSTNGERQLERFRAKWEPVRVKKTCQIKNLELRV
jgi:hypothetical protein